MKRLLCVLVVLFASIDTRIEAGFVNGGFESGDLFGWTSGGTGAVAVVNSYTTTTGADVTFDPTEGRFFAILEGGEREVYTTLQQSFSVAAGDTLLGSVFYDSNDLGPDYIDDAYIKILEGDVLLFYADVLSAGDFENTPWTTFAYTFSADGSYTIEAGVRNTIDEGFSPVLGIDSFFVQSPIDPAAVPEPGSLLLWSLSGLGAFFAQQRRSKQTDCHHRS